MTRDYAITSPANRNLPTPRRREVTPKFCCPIPLRKMAVTHRGWLTPAQESPPLYTQIPAGRRSAR